MKTYLIMAAAICVTLGAQAQTNIFPNDGNVGIGTTSPGFGALVIQRNNNDGGVSNAPSIAVTNTNTADPAGSGYNVAWASFLAGNGAVLGQIVSNYGTGANVPFTGGSGVYITARTNHPIIFATGATTTEKVRITNDGFVGIGTANPSSQLHLYQSSNDGIPTRLENASASGTYKFLQFAQFGSNAHGMPHWAHTGVVEGAADGGLVLSAYAGDLKFSTGSTRPTRMTIRNSDGNVGIGTTNPQAKLAVNGDIFSKKVRVTQTGWPDYVFEAGYRLRPLGELEQFIDRHHHLPEVPAAAEVEKHGLDLGENQAVLLKKIEELTLYIIEQKKELDRKDAEVAEVKKVLQRVLQRLDKLEGATK